ncbi:MAG: transcriptional repressor NrdR, partial [Actinobacteria bacterium]|nr:transcriptional repressor NrdR [Actinomycetota bacterium]
MHCPFCRSEDTKVIDSRTNDDGTQVKRRRQCVDCSRRFSTAENAMLQVIKRNGVIESFDRNKIINGVRKACQGRPVTEADLAGLAQRVEETLRLEGLAEVDAHDVGLAVLTP